MKTPATLVPSAKLRQQQVGPAAIADAGGGDTEADAGHLRHVGKPGGANGETWDGGGDESWEPLMV